MKHHPGILAVLILLIPATSFSGLAQQADMPMLLNYSGSLTGSKGKPLTTMTPVTFTLYAAQNGGKQLWVETKNVQPDATGHYAVTLGSSSILPASLFISGQPLWLSVRPKGQEERSRIMVVSVPCPMPCSPPDPGSASNRLYERHKNLQRTFPC
jgi:hypothetical protein